MTKPIPLYPTKRQRPVTSASLLQIARWYREAAENLEREASILAKQERWRNGGVG